MRRVIELSDSTGLFKAKCALALTMVKTEDFQFERIFKFIVDKNVEGVIEDADRVIHEVMDTFGITVHMYYKSIKKYKNYGLMKRVGNCYIVHPVLTQSDDPTQDELVLRIKK